MHEMTIALHIIDIAENAAKKEQARRINSIQLEIGALAGVIPEALTFCLSEAQKNTLAAQAEINFEITPARAFCSECGHSFPAFERAVPCPLCGETVIQMTEGTALKVKKINID